MILVMLLVMLLLNFHSYQTFQISNLLSFETKRKRRIYIESIKGEPQSNNNPKTSQKEPRRKPNCSTSTPLRLKLSSTFTLPDLGQIGSSAARAKRNERNYETN